MAIPAESSETRVLVLAPVGRDAGLAARVLDAAGIAAQTCRDLAELRAEIQAGAGVVVLTEEALTPAALDDLSEIFASQLPWSDLPVLVFCGSETRSEALAFPVRRLSTLANVTFLDRPTRKVALVSAVRAALRARTRQYEVRDLLLELEKGVRERDRFLAMLGHELRNPLGAILTSVQLMEQKNKETLAAERGVIHRQTMLLTRLVDDLLDVARVTSGKIALERVAVDVRELVERCVEAQSGTATARRINVAFSTDDKPFLVEGDPVRLEQIVNNLLANALKYTPSGGSIFVGVSSDGAHGEVRIRDTGVGIDPRILPRIFDLFTQASSTLARSQGGLGVGLTLVRSLVGLHQGTVRAESPGRDQGSTFTLRLPLTRATAAEVSPRALPLPSRRARKILLIEDNRDVRDGLKRLLEEVGHDVRAAEDGVSGFLLAVQHRPEVAFVDIGLPRLDGYEVARRIRGALGRNIVLIAITGYGMPEDRRRALESGFDAHLTKPITLHAILTLLAHNPPVESRDVGPEQDQQRSGGDSVA